MRGVADRERVAGRAVHERSVARAQLVCVRRVGVDEVRCPDRAREVVVSSVRSLDDAERALAFDRRVAAEIVVAGQWCGSQA